MKELPFSMARDTELEKWRAETFWTKEPETIAWIDSFGPGFFWDVGANVGIYSLYAAVRHPDTVKVYAFEPYPDNFVALKGNIAANGLGGAVRPVLAALGREEGFNYFYSPRAGRGVSGGQVGLPIDEGGEAFEILEKHIGPCATGDGFAGTLLGPPTYVKIDVDGREYDVLRGMLRILACRDLASVLVEMNRNRIEIDHLMRTNGFTTENPFNEMQNHSRLRRQRDGIRAENVVFTRAE